MTKPKDQPITPEIAAKQADFHVRTAADYFATSVGRLVGVKHRDGARAKFIEHTRLALPSMGLENFLSLFEQGLRGTSASFNEAKPVIEQIAAELEANGREGDLASLSPRTTIPRPDPEPMKTVGGPLRR